MLNVLWLCQEALAAPGAAVPTSRRISTVPSVSCVAGEPGSVLGGCPGSPLCVSCAPELTARVGRQAQLGVSWSSSCSILSRTVLGEGFVARGAVADFGYFPSQHRSTALPAGAQGEQPCPSKGAHPPFPYVPQNRRSLAQIKGTALALTGQNRSVETYHLCFLSWSWG